MSAAVTLVGRLAIDPEPKATASGKSVTRFVVITSRRKFNKDTNSWEDVDVTSWQCSAWDILGERVGRLKKGDAVVVSGAVSQRSWDDSKTGEKRYAMQVTANNVGVDLRWYEMTPSAPASREDAIVASFEAESEGFDSDIPF